MLLIVLFLLFLFFMHMVIGGLAKLFIIHVNVQVLGYLIEKDLKFY